MYGKYAYEKYEGEAMKPVTEFNDCYIDFYIKRNDRALVP